MSPSLHIALRFISQRKRSIFVSLLGITCGVALFICTQAQTQGFEKFYIQTVLGTKGAVLVADRFQERYSGGSVCRMMASSASKESSRAVTKKESPTLIK